MNPSQPEKILKQLLKYTDKKIGELKLEWTVDNSIEYTPSILELIEAYKNEGSYNAYMNVSCMLHELLFKEVTSKMEEELKRFKMKDAEPETMLTTLINKVKDKLNELKSELTIDKELFMNRNMIVIEILDSCEREGSYITYTHVSNMLHKLLTTEL